MDYSKFIIISDVDNTLLNSKKELSPENRLAIENFRKKGGIFIPATGRSESQISREWFDIVLPNPCILCNGTMVYDFQSKCALHSTPLAKETTILFIRRLSEKINKVDVSLISDGGIVRIKSFQELERINGTWYKLTLTGEDRELLEQLRDNSGLTLEFSQPTVLELMNDGASKATAMKWLTAQSEYSGRIVVAVGDYDNDVKMIKDADVGIAVKNAVPLAKQVADIVTISNDEHVMREIIEYILSEIDINKIKEEAFKCSSR